MGDDVSRGRRVISSYYGYDHDFFCQPLDAGLERLLVAQSRVTGFSHHGHLHVKTGSGEQMNKNEIITSTI